MRLAPLLDERSAQPDTAWSPPLQRPIQNINGSNEPLHSCYAARQWPEEAGACDVAQLSTPPWQTMRAELGLNAPSAARESTHAPGRGLQRGVPLQPLSPRPPPRHHLLAPPPATGSPLLHPPAAGDSTAQQRPSPSEMPVLALSSPWESSWSNPQHPKRADNAREDAAACTNTPRKRPSGLKRFAFNSSRHGGSPNRTSEQPTSGLSLQSNMIDCASIPLRQSLPCATH